MIFPRPTAALAALALAASGCHLCQDPAPDSAVATTTGELEVILHERGSCGISLCTLSGWGRVLVYPAGGAVPERDVWFFDSTRLTLPAGRYDVLVAPDGAPLHRPASDVALGPGVGLRVEHSSWSDADATTLALIFAAGTEARTAEVVAFLGATALVGTVPAAAFPEVRIALAYRDHPELAAARAMAAFPDVVVGYRLNDACHGTGWFPASSGGSGGHHHDHWD